MNDRPQAVFSRLLATMQRLRDPINGCDWDKAQTFDSLKSFTLEETYEVLDAITRHDFSDLKTELGDLLFHIVFYAEMADEQQQFNFYDVCNTVCDKLERRHPHVFGDAKHKPQWEALKQRERDAKAQTSILDDIPGVMPALMQADKIQKRCASVGFDWQELTPVVAKVREELDEVLQEASAQSVNQQRIAEEVGDLLFACVNLARHLGQDAEQALLQANHKFSQRFRQIEQHLAEQQRTPQQASLAEMEALWQQIKAQEQSKPA